MREPALVVYGAGGHGKVVADILQSAGQDVAGFLDDVKPIGAFVVGLPVLGTSDWLDSRPGTRVALGVGDNALRARHAEVCVAKGAELVTAIHPSAVVARTSVVEIGCVLMAYAVINPDARVARGVIVNTCAVVEHDCSVGEFAHLSPNATMGGNCHIGAFAQLGIGAAMLPGTRIGEHSIVGGGGLVVHDVPAHTIAMGVPARSRRPNKGHDAVTARLLAVDDPFWRHMLGETAHDIYHRPEYARLDAAAGETPLAAWIEAAGFGLLVPMQRRPIAGQADVFDAISPYGYAGPLWWRGRTPDADAVQKLATGLRDLLSAESIVSLLVRLHPLIDAVPTALESFGALIEHGETIAIDLHQDLSAIRGAMRQTHRNEIAQAERLGVLVEHDRELHHLDAFIALYEQTMQRVGASPAYLFSRSYFEALRTGLAGHCHLFLARAEGKVAAAALFFEENGIVQYHLSGMDHALASTHATKLVLAKAIEWAQGRKNQWMHLGGGVGTRTDGVFAFKAGFSPLRRRYRTLRVVADEPRYRALGGLGPTDSLGETEPFFPGYRRGSA